MMAGSSAHVILQLSKVIISYELKLHKNVICSSKIKRENHEN